MPRRPPRRCTDFLLPRLCVLAACVQYCVSPNVALPPKPTHAPSSLLHRSAVCFQAVSADTKLFKHLRTVWRFHPSPAPSHAHGKGSQLVQSGVEPGAHNTRPSHSQSHPHCLVDFMVEYEFTAGLHAALAQQFFDEVSRKIMAAFEQRCDTLHPVIGGPSRRA